MVTITVSKHVCGPHVVALMSLVQMSVSYFCPVNFLFYISLLFLSHPFFVHFSVSILIHSISIYFQKLVTNSKL